MDYIHKIKGNCASQALIKGGIVPPFGLFLKKTLLKISSRIAAKASRVMPNLGRSLLIMGKKMLMMYRVDETR